MQHIVVPKVEQAACLTSKSKIVQSFDLAKVTLVGGGLPGTTYTTSTSSVCNTKLRCATEQDQSRLISFFNSLPTRSLESRFFGSGRLGTIIKQQATTTENHVIVMAEDLAERGSRVIGLANCHLTGGTPLSGNIGIVINPEVEGLGLGYALFRTGIQTLKELGVKVLQIEYQGENRRVGRLPLRAYNEKLLSDLEQRTSFGFVIVKARL